MLSLLQEETPHPLAAAAAASEPCLPRLAAAPALRGLAGLTLCFIGSPVLAAGTGASSGHAGLSLGLAGMLLMMALSVLTLAYRHGHERGAGLGLGGWMLSLALTAVLGVAGPIGSATLTPALNLGLLALATWCSLKFFLSRTLPMPLWQDLLLLGQMLLLPALSSTLQNSPSPATAAWAGPLHQFAPAWLALQSLLALASGWKRRVRWPAAEAADSGSAAAARRQETRFASPLLVACGLGAVASAASAALAPIAPGPAILALGLLLPLSLLALGLHYLLNFAQDRQEAEKEHAQFEHRMQERVTEMERNFGALAEQRLEQVTERERKRIAADLHDDLGAKLLTIVHTSESDRISSLAREALEEMRLSVRGLTGKPVHLLDALGDWRAEVVSRLGQANINAEWKSPSEDITHTLPARAYVQTTRIFREAVSNIIKHSGGTNCTISCSVQDGDFVVVIQDNGQGIPAELDGRLDRGHGMASMKSRAKQMHGQCLVESGPGWGTVIRLTIPL